MACEVVGGRLSAEFVSTSLVMAASDNDRVEKKR
jgi:hypothetical protein